MVAAAVAPELEVPRVEIVESTVAMQGNKAVDCLLQDPQRFVSPDADEDEAQQVLKGASEGTLNMVCCNVSSTDKYSSLA